MEYTFNYKAAGANAVRFIVVALVIGGVGVYLLVSGMGIRYRGASLTSDQTSWVSYGLLAFALVFLIVGVVAIVGGSRPRAIIIGPTRLVVPKSELSNTPVAIDPRSITGVKVHTQGGSSRAVISYPGGKVSVLSSYLGSTQVFAEFQQLLEAARVGALPGPR